MFHLQPKRFKYNLIKDNAQNAAFHETTGPEGVRWASSEHCSCWELPQQFNSSSFQLFFHINDYVSPQSCPNIMYVEEHCSRLKHIELKLRKETSINCTSSDSIKVKSKLSYFNQDNQSGVTKRKHKFKTMLSWWCILRNRS